MLFGKLPARKTDRVRELIEASEAEVQLLIACLPKAPSAVRPPNAEAGPARCGFELRHRLS
ncbi:MAG TPA: hypothetical protein VE288_17720 [Rubrobacteraceae bacterium]|jgi:hypothetical protein|nr:hypothetical protein [Rubrobacteraceae bacterium]